MVESFLFYKIYLGRCLYICCYVYIHFVYFQKDEFLIVETEENTSDLMIDKVEMLTSQNLQLQV